MNYIKYFLVQLLDRAIYHMVHNTQKIPALRQTVNSRMYILQYTAVPSNDQSSHKWRRELQFSQYADKKIILIIYIQQQIYAFIWFFFHSQI